MGCTRQTVNKFLAGKAISKELFTSLCNKLRLNWEDIAELRFDQNENSWTVPSMNRLPSNIPLTEEAGAATLVVEPNNVQTCITYDTINGQVVITIPCDINSFFNNEEKRNDLLKALIMLSGDKNATIAKIEQGSIKITFNLSPDGIKRLEEEPDKILLMARIISISKGEELDLSDTDLSGVDLSGVDLSGAYLSGAYLSGADLSGAYLRDADLSDADLSDANLRDAYLRDAYLSASDLRGADLSGTYLSGADLSGANLSGGDLSGAYLRDANLSDADLSGANLSVANLSGAYLRDANLSGADLRDANLRDADLRDADLSGADLSGANLSGTNLNGTNLSGADLRGANLSGANLSGANLSGANLSGANVKNARFGNNPGINEYAKRELKQRGAIFEDSQGELLAAALRYRSKVPTS